jgi:hypothetical protein
LPLLIRYGWVFPFNKNEKDFVELVIPVRMVILLLPAGPWIRLRRIKINRFQVSGFSVQQFHCQTSYMKLHEFRCHFREVGRATVPAKPVGTVADPTAAQDQSFFSDQTGRSRPEAVLILNYIDLDRINLNDAKTTNQRELTKHCHHRPC